MKKYQLCQYKRGPNRNRPSHFVTTDTAANLSAVTVLMTVSDKEEGKRLAALLDQIFDEGVEHHRQMMLEYLKQ